MTYIKKKSDGDFMMSTTFQVIGEEMVTNWLVAIALCLLCLLLQGGYIAWGVIIPYSAYKHCILSKRRRRVITTARKSKKFGVIGDE